MRRVLSRESLPAEPALPELAHFYQAAWEAGNFYLLSAVHGSQYFTTCTSKKEGEEKHTNILKMFIFKECVFQGDKMLKEQWEEPGGEMRNCGYNVIAVRTLLGI